MACVEEGENVILPGAPRDQESESVEMTVMPIVFGHLAAIGMQPGDVLYLSVIDDGAGEVLASTERRMVPAESDEARDEVRQLVIR